MAAGLVSPCLPRGTEDAWLDGFELEGGEIEL